MIGSVGFAPYQQNARAAGGFDTSTAPASAVGGRLKTVEVLDPLFNEVAARFTIPNNWVFDGTILRPHLGPALVFRASSPDGLTGLQRLPRYDSVAHTDPKMRQFYQAQKVTVTDPMSAKDFLNKVVLPESRPGVTVIGPEAMPALGGLAVADQQANDRYARQASGQRPKHQHSDGARVRIAYTFNGQPVEEAIVVVTTTTELPANYGNTMWLSQATITGARAPRGQLDGMMKQLVAISESENVSASWEKRQAAFALQNAQQQQAAIIANGRRRLAENKAIFERSMASAAAMEKGRHAGAMGTSDHMGDVRGMVNPATGQSAKVSNQFNYSYVDQNGNVVHTNSATYNPNAELRGNWTQLQPMKP
ncbi:MAG: hypothetical protein M3Z31_18150 [Pseudomonadota bacterium]|nr:hypothetical protein [Pseudomonadota bacterium]